MNPLILHGTLDSLGAIAQYVKAAAAEAGLDKTETYQLRLAVDEIATNIVTHSYKAAPGEIVCQAYFSENSLTISLEDTGAPFDPTKHVLADELKQPLERRKIGGLGIYLATHNLTHLEYQRVEGRNRNLLVMSLRNAPSDKGQGEREVNTL